jgi:uncharacterized protein YfiM (DUF2279 family)
MKKPNTSKPMAVNKLRRSFPFASFALLLILFCSLSSFSIHAQSDSSVVNRRKLRTIVIASATGYTAGLIVLNHVWYKDTERQSFRFFNDNAEWKQLDKLGHFYNSFYLSYTSSKLLTSSGVADRKAYFFGALAGFLLTVPIEIMDGFSDGYGASAGDLIADAAGPAFFLAQKLSWNEIRMYPKLSFHRSGYAPLRPALLGDNLLSQIVKDYNGQTFWLSFDVDKFIAFPKWLNIALGYGGQDMIYARDEQNRAAGFHPFRQYYFALDFDVTSIKTKSKVIKTLLFVVNAIKLPAPTVEFSKKGTQFRPFYF